MKSILIAKNISELIYQLKINKGLQVVGGCTNITELPEKSISTYGIKELSQIVRHERYIDIGPGVSLSKILNIGQNHLPQILYEALNSIANPLIRNIATIGGNICNENQKLTLFAPLVALEAKLEFKNQSETKFEQIQNFKKVPDGFILSNIRVPIVDADLSIFRRIGPEHSISEQSASFAFVACTERNSLIDVRLAFAGPFTFKSKTLENTLVGHRLPLNHKDINLIMGLILEEFNQTSRDQMISDVMKQQFLNLTRYSFEQLR